MWGRALAPALALAPVLAFAPAPALAVAPAFAPALAITTALALALLLLLLLLMLPLLLLLCSKGSWSPEPLPLVQNRFQRAGTISEGFAPNVFSLLGGCLMKGLMNHSMIPRNLIPYSNTLNPKYLTPKP